MQPLLTPDQMRAADRFTIESIGLPDTVLMEHAALAILDRLVQRFGSSLDSLQGLIVAGPGNNGGDALALARLLLNRGQRAPGVVLLGTELERTPLCKLHAEILHRQGIPLHSKLEDQVIINADWIVDGIFGTGLSRPVDKSYLDIITRINRRKRSWVIAIDIPSGLSGNSGQPLPEAIHASETVALGYLKTGLVTGSAFDFGGHLSLATIQIPRTVPGVEVESFLFERKDASVFLPKRKPSGNKGDYGHVYVSAGLPEKEGACILTAMASLRAGSGLTTIFGGKEVLKELRTRLPADIMTMTHEDNLFEKTAKTAFVLGPGMGTYPGAWELLEQALRSEAKLVLDADAITLLAKHPKESGLLLKKRPSSLTILTPHPKEASRLLKGTVEDIEKNRYDSVRHIASRFHSTVLLKGKGTLIHTPGQPTWVVTAGTSSLSKGGAGDILSGIIATFLAQGLEARTAAALGAFAHGRAAELLSQERGEEHSALASEVAGHLSEVWKELCRTR